MAIGDDYRSGRAVPPRRPAPPDADPAEDSGYAPLEGFDENGFPLAGGRAASAPPGGPPRPAPRPPGGYPPPGYPPPGHPPPGHPPPGGYPPQSNPYAPPAPPYAPAGSAPGYAPYHTGAPLASRLTRLGAALLDGLLSFVAMLPGIVMLWMAINQRRFDQQKLLGGVLVMLAGGLLVSVYQWYLIATRGQTLAKKWLGIRIVRLDGSLPGFVHGVILRNWVMGLIGNVPYIGAIVSGLVDPLMIFGESRRCLHDHIAGTEVVVAEPDADPYRRY